MLGEAVLAAVTEAVFGYLLEATGITDAIRAKLKDRKRRAAFKKALRQAHEQFSHSHPDEANSLFDEQFLKKRAAPILAMCMLRSGADPVTLGAKWVEQMPGLKAMADKDKARISAVAADFLNLLDGFLGQDEDFQSLFDSRALDSIAVSSQEVVDILLQNLGFAQRTAEALEALLAGRGAGGRVEVRTDQTPGMSRRFIGREKELADLQKLIEQTTDNRVGIAAIQGTGGIGKTMLAEELLRRIGSQYPGGVIVERRGPQPRAVQDTLRDWAGYALGEKPDKDLTPGEVHSLLAERGPLLVLLDDIWPVDTDIGLLLGALPREATTIMTSRNEALVRGLGAAVYMLPMLTLSDGLALLNDRLKDLKPRPKKETLKRLYHAVDGHALSLELNAGRLRLMPDIDAEIARLEHSIQHGDLSQIAALVPGLEPGRDNNLLASLDLTRQALEKADPALWERFALLGVFAPDAPFDLPAVMAVWEEADKGAASAALAALAGYALLRLEGGRYIQHIILRGYALGLLQEHEGKHEAAAAHHAGHYFEIARDVKTDWREADRQADNIAFAAELICDLLGDDLITVLGEPEAPETLPPFDEGAAQVGLSMALAISGYVRDRRVHAGLRWLRAGLAAAQLVQDKKSQGLLLNVLGLWYHDRGQPEKALDYYQRALPIREEVSDRAGLATTFNNIGAVYQVIGQPEQALDYFQRALSIHVEVGNRAVEATTLNNIGLVYQATGQPEKALDYFQRALPIQRDIGAVQNVATQLNNIAILLHENPSLSRQDETILMLEEAIAILENAGLEYDGSGASIDVYRDLLSQWKGETPE